jgi:hypothetical protein
VKIRFYQKISFELYPEFYFGDEILQEKLFTPISLWFLTEGEGTLPWSDVSLVFSIQSNELEVEFDECVIDDVFYSHIENEDNFEYLLDVNKLKDGIIYSL